MIVPFAAGGPTDLDRARYRRAHGPIARPIRLHHRKARHRRRRYDRRNAGRARGAGRLYTLDLATWSTHVVTPVIYQLQYDDVPGFRSGCLADPDASLLLSLQDGHPGQQFGKELIAWLKADPNAVLLGSAGGTDQVAPVICSTVGNRPASRFRSCAYRGLSPGVAEVMFWPGGSDLLVRSTVLTPCHCKSTMAASRVMLVTAEKRTAVDSRDSDGR